jgi:hypothetical protein
MERKRIAAETAVESSWYHSEDKFRTNEEIAQAVERGDLIHVEPEGDSYQLIGRLRNGTEPDVLRPKAAHFLDEVTTKWAEAANTESILLAVTSLHRTAQLQQELINSAGGYLANSPDESSHLTGYSFDISCRSYYQKTEEGTKPVQTWNPASGQFNPSVFIPLRELLEDYRQKGLCNFVIENAGKDVLEPSVYHVCVGPKYQAIPTVGQQGSVSQESNAA